jgi:hypothetical protein
VGKLDEDVTCRSVAGVRIILKCILKTKQQQHSVWTGMTWLGIYKWRTVVRKAMNRRVPKKCGEFLDWLRDYQLLKRDSAPWNYFVAA